MRILARHTKLSEWRHSHFTLLQSTTLHFLSVLSFKRQHFSRVSLLQLPSSPASSAMSLSKHQRELPELCLLAIVSQMSLADRVSAHRVCPEWYQRVREANSSVNRKDNSITILAADMNLEYLENLILIKHDFQNAKPVARQMKRTRRPYLRVLHRFTKWNCLQFSVKNQLNTATFQHIMSSFPDITELNFVTSFGLEFLVEMLQTEPWRSQLTRLRVVCTISKKIHEEQSAAWDKWKASSKSISPRLRAMIGQRGTAEYHYALGQIGKIHSENFSTMPKLDDMDVHRSNTEDQSAVEQALFTAINDLPALQYLNLQEIPLYELPILAQLKEIIIEKGNPLSLKCMTTLLHSLREYATDNVDNLRVDLLTRVDLDTINRLIQELSEPLLRCFTCLSDIIYCVEILDRTLHSYRLTAFPSLTSLSLQGCFTPEWFTTLFPYLSQLRQLVYLDLDVTWNTLSEELPPRPRDQLLSVKALRLSLGISSTHLQSHWFNLSVTMPNLQDIYFRIELCKMCGYGGYNLNSDNSLQCFRTNFRAIMANGGFPTQQITCCSHDKPVSTHELLFDDE